MQPSPLQRNTGDSSNNQQDGAGAAGAAGAADASKGGGGDATAAANSNSSSGQNNNDKSKYDPQDQLVLDYLKQKGMNQAASELVHKLDAKLREAQGSSGGDADKQDENKTARERFVEEDEKARAQRTLLAKTTGGGYGYDRDSAWPIVQWGIPDTQAAAVADAERKKQAASKSSSSSSSKHNNATTLGVEEARSFLDAFVHFQLWVLQLPDHHATSLSTQSGASYDNVVLQSPADNPILRAQKAILENKDQPVSAIVQTMISPPPPDSQAAAAAESSTNNDGVYNLPPSVKPELLAVSFALFVHTYADLLEVGMETTAQSLREAFAPIYQALYPDEFRDLAQCSTTESMMRLNSHNSQHMEAVGHLKAVLLQVAQYQLRKDEHIAHMQSNLNSSNSALTPQQLQDKLANDPRVKDCEKKIHILQSKYKEMSQKATQWFDKMHDLPFLRRARATRWILTLSTSTYAVLSAFLGSRDDSLLAMSTLLQTKCTVQVEKRDPLPYTPASVLLEGGAASFKEKEQQASASAFLAVNTKDGVNWAVPAPRPEVHSADERIPFPKFHLAKEYETEAEADKDVKTVQFNRAMLVNGFRRLEALERKREYEVLTPLAQKRARQGEAICRTLPNPLEPSILLSTLSASSAPGPLSRKKTHHGEAGGAGSNNSHLSSIWEEPGIGICCAKTDRFGRRVAAGCDDAGVRIHNLESDVGGGEPCEVLLGHKNGFPVFDVDWNRDGRALLSSGGDGSVRLWDTMAVGPFGETTTPRANAATPASASASTKASDKKKGSKQQQQQNKDEAAHKEMEMTVPGWRAGEAVAYTSGAAIAVYRGHGNAPVWSVSFAPCGYYFCSAAADATARIWTTDRPVPVRLLSGHTSANVNCVQWHPNANYVVTGSDDKTARLWDIQTGQTVRLLTGASAGINKVSISPGGRYCAGADYSGVVHLWDLGTGKKVSVLRCATAQNRADQNMVHSLTYSACGQALAVGGDDCCVRVWDLGTTLAGTTGNVEPIRKNPSKSFPTRRTVLLDLQYTKRNLLLAVGKYVSPVPLISTVAD